MSEAAARIISAIIYAVIAFVLGLAIENFVLPQQELGGLVGALLATATLIVTLGPWVKAWPWKRIIRWFLALLAYWGVAEIVKAKYGNGWYQAMWAFLVLGIIGMGIRWVLIQIINRPRASRPHDD